MRPSRAATDATDPMPPYIPWPARLPDPWGRTGSAGPSEPRCGLPYHASMAPLSIAGTGPCDGFCCPRFHPSALHRAGSTFSRVGGPSPKQLLSSCGQCTTGWNHSSGPSLWARSPPCPSWQAGFDWSPCPCRNEPGQVWYLHLHPRRFYPSGLRPLQLTLGVPLSHLSERCNGSQLRRSRPGFFCFPVVNRLGGHPKNHASFSG